MNYTSILKLLSPTVAVSLPIYGVGGSIPFENLRPVSYNGQPARLLLLQLNRALHRYISSCSHTYFVRILGPRLSFKCYAEHFAWHLPLPA
jgi:hypothetical protein